MKYALVLGTFGILATLASITPVSAQTVPIVVIEVVDSNGVPFASVSERVHGKTINYFAAVGAHFGDATAVAIDASGITLSDGRVLRVDRVASARQSMRRQADLKRAGVSEPLVEVARTDGF